MPDGRLAIIDYGQCVHLSDQQRKSLARLIVALAERRRADRGAAPAGHAGREAVAGVRGGGGKGSGLIGASAACAADESVAAAAAALGFRTRRMSTPGLVSIPSLYLYTMYVCITGL